MIAQTRKLTIIAKDPGLRIGKTASMAFVQVEIPAERLAKGPTGYRVKVVDYNASEQLSYLDEQKYDLPDGNFVDPFAPLADETSESPAYQKRLLDNPNFHAQNSYAIVMRTLARFESALGRRVNWSSGIHQLNVAPHAFEQANAFYSPPDHALMFGYFQQGDGKTIFTSLSHDIVAHETTHALLDGIRPRFTEASSPDQGAIHEGLADIVALLSIFSLEPVVAAALGEGRTYVGPGGIETIPASKLKPETIKKSILLGLARQVGIGLGERDALRRSVMLEPSATILEDPSMREEHMRGEVLVAAVINAFILLWTKRIAALGTLSRNRYNLSLVVEEGAKLANQLLTMCIRAIDYCPPTDVDFGQYLAALLTADAEVAPDDSRFGYRQALRSSFGEYGLTSPADAADANSGMWLRYAGSEKLVYGRSNYDGLTRDRHEFFRFLWENRQALGISERCEIEVISMDGSVRLGPDGMWLKEYICQYVQSAKIFGAEVNSVLKCARPPQISTTERIEAFGGGVIILDQYGQVKYHIANAIDDGPRQFVRLNHLAELGNFTSPRFQRNRFALLHLKKMGA